MTTTFPRFFDLPAELRSQILTLLLPAPQTLEVTDPSSRPPLNLLLSHPLIYGPVSDAFYAANTLRCTPRTLAALPTATLRRLRNLVVDLPRLRESFLSIALPLLSDALLAGSLRCLTVTIRLSAWPHRSAEDLPHGLCRDLARLLADPYLEVAELKVSGAHAAGWCEFHPGTTCLARAAPDDDREARGPVDIDWRLMAGKLGAGVDIVAVGNRSVG